MPHIGTFVLIMLLTACESISDFSQTEAELNASAVVDSDVVNNPKIGKDYTLTIKDNPEAARFDLKLVSRSNSPLCLSYGAWPYSGKEYPAGSLNFRSEYVYIESAGKKFPIETTNFGYRIYPKNKPLGDSHIIKAHEELIGAIPYSRFQGGFDPTFHQDRLLVFPSTPIFCWQYFGEPLTNMTPMNNVPTADLQNINAIANPPIEGKDYILSVKENKIEAVFEIELKSMTDEFLCISDDSWPTSKHYKNGEEIIRIGSKHARKLKTHLRSNGKVFNIKKDIFKGCSQAKNMPYGCSKIIEPMQNIISIVSHSDFDSSFKPNKHLDKMLIFNPSPLFCWQAFEDFTPVN